MNGCSCPANESHGPSCEVLRDFRLPPAQLMAEYNEQLRRRGLELESGSAPDVPYRLQKLGVAADAILGLRSLRTTAAVDAARRFVKSDPAEKRVLLLAGARGIGKTVAAACVLSAFVRRHDWNAQPSGGRQRPPFMWVHASEVTAETDFGRVDPFWVESLKLCRLLILDDLGKEGTVPGLGALRDVMVHRMEKQRLTVITCNEGIAEVTERYGESWLSRMAAFCLMPDLVSEKNLRARARP